ncbi:uncharacterized protein LOC107406408 isoform X1 [Ziziphus jujuba]|uniref:Uncharacterized protein LOC107406408 isoform X1 n=1 Tax=Ziziphus jujuba TaxID=326968 RepID=A0A6P3Z4G5_ZIZJJ|nr:uncharacterized protein LOC107406408 isoform X1 [Ziziphus jujuba]
MVQLMSLGMVGSEAKDNKTMAVKLEVEESPEIKLGPLQKRPKLDSFSQQLSSDATAVLPTEYNPLDEPSPLGLRLKKSPSLLDLIQMKLSRGNAAKLDTLGKKSHKGSGNTSAMDKLKASNFPASILQIGSWEYKSKHEGDLVAKCYFAKHKLVWEVLDGSLKNKIEIQWSDIVALNATYPDDAPGTLNVVLARQPLFFRETNPQPRKHTLWQATSDFTGGQASIHRRHFLQCPQGLLGKHFEKLVQCDPRINFLSQQPEIVLDSPYFESRVTTINDPNEFSHGFHKKGEDGSVFLGLQDAISPLAAQSSSKNEQELSGRAPENYSQDIPSPSSVMDAHAIEEIKSFEAVNSKLLSNWDQIKVPGLHPSVSMSDLVNHIGNCISEKMTSGNSLFDGKQQQQRKDMLEEIAQYLFNDSQNAMASDEKSLMSRVNSLCCLLQKDPSVAQNLQGKNDDSLGGNGTGETSKSNFNYASGSKATPGFPSSMRESNDVSADCKQAQAMSRKDSFGELLLTLPRIASLPQFFFNLAQDSDNQAR